MISIILFVLKASIILSVIAIGLKASFSDSIYLFQRPGHLFRALLSMNVIMPLIALAIATTFDLNFAVRVALVALSVSPIPPILPNRALKAGGTEAYTIGLHVAMALLSIIVIPITMAIFGSVTGAPLSMQASAVAMVVLTTILGPLAIGIVIRKLSTPVADRIARPLGVISLLLLVLCSIPVLIGEAKPIWSLVGDGTVLTFVAFAVIGLIVGHFLGGPEPEIRPVLALTTAARHPALALAIAHANYPDQKLAAPAVLLYFLISFIIPIPYLKWVIRERAKNAAPETKRPLEA